MKRRKRHILVNTLGHLLKVVVHPANIQDQDGATLVFTALQLMLRLRFQKIWADGGYRGALIDWYQEHFETVLEIVSPPPTQTGFAVLPKWWLVERTFAWFGNYRRLSKAYEEGIASSEGMIYLAAIHTLLKRSLVYFSNGFSERDGT